MILKLIGKSNIAKDTASLVFKPNKDIKWLPGQYFYVTLDSLIQDDPRGATREFSNAASPTEGNMVRVVTRIRDDSGFKQTISSLKKGQNVQSEGPNGTFILDEHEKGDHVLIAGGIGITPFRSMIKYNLDKNLPNKILLIYSNKNVEETAFKEEFDEWEKDSKNFKVVYTMTQEKASKWKGPNQRLDARFIQKYSKNFNLPTFWICGPPGFVQAIETQLIKTGAESGKIRSEKFTGY